MPQEGWRIGEVYEKYPDCRNHAEAFVKELFGDYLAKVESLFSDVGFELDDGGAICFPDANGDIRRIDSNGNTVEVRGIGDPGWNEWRDLFPDDALYYQPERAGHPHCGTSAAAINFFDVYRNRENAETAHPDCKILSFAFCDIEQPVFLDVEQPKYHAKSNDPESGLSANHNTEAAQLFRVRICGQPDADHILVRAVSMEDAAQVARDVREEGGTEARQVEIGVYVEPENCRTGLVYYPVQTERMFDISEEPIERNRPAQRDLR